jgi:hypothetical protein
MKLTIDRSEWRCGGDSYNKRTNQGNTQLLGYKGMKCCLGFLALECGFSENQINNISNPCNLRSNLMTGSGLRLNDKQKSYFDKLMNGAYHSDFTHEAIGINDDYVLTDEQREKKLTKLFADNGIDLTFTGEYPE